MTLVRAKIDVNIPRKRKGHCTQHEKGLQKFFEAIMQAILRHINFDGIVLSHKYLINNNIIFSLVVKCVLLASPGFVKDHFYEYLFQQAIKLDNKLLLDNRAKFVLCHASSGFKHSLKGMK